MKSSPLSRTSKLRLVSARTLFSTVSVLMGTVTSVACVFKADSQNAQPSTTLPVPSASTQPSSEQSSESSITKTMPTNDKAQSSKDTLSSTPAAVGKPVQAQILVPANSPARDELASLRVEVMSLKEKVSSLQRKFDVILKGQRSGLYDEAAVAETISQFQNPKSKTHAVPPLTSEGPIDRYEHGNDIQRREKALNLEKPEQLVDKAIVLLEQREFGRVAQMLENFQQRFPNNGLSPLAELTLAEAYVELKSPQQALTHIRTFYLQHPNDPQLVRAKWLEGRSQEQLDAPQKASQLFREIIALDPQSEFALKARAALEKIAGGSTQ